MRKILAPHKEQDGWVYVREFRSPSLPSMTMDDGTVVQNFYEPGGASMGYRDNRPTSRIISSRKVERAVETDDYLRLCAEEGLMAAQEKGGLWGVAGDWDPEMLTFRVHAWGPTLRIAYHRYKAAAGDAS